MEPPDCTKAANDGYRKSLAGGWELKHGGRATDESIGRSPDGTSGAYFKQPTKEYAIISVEKTYPTLAQRCHDMAEGASVYLSPAEIPYDLHRYRDGWYAFWKSPPNGQIGRLLATREELSLFLNGKWAVGKPLRNVVGLRKFLSEEVQEAEE